MRLENDAVVDGVHLDIGLLVPTQMLADMTSWWPVETESDGEWEREEGGGRERGKHRSGRRKGEG